MDLVRFRILGVMHDFWRIGLLVAISVPISSDSFVVRIWDPGGDRAFTVVSSSSLERLWAWHPINVPIMMLFCWKFVTRRGQS
ncbi:unnamed protein product [Prunus armeniaca]